MADLAFRSAVVWKWSRERLASTVRSRWGRLAISTCLFALVLRALPFERQVIVATLARARWLDLFLALLVQVGAVYCSATRTQVVLVLDGRRASALQLWHLSMVGEALNRLAPGNIGSLSYLTTKLGGQEHTRVLSLLLVEKAVYLASVLLVGAASTFALGAPLLGGVLLAIVLTCTLLALGLRGLARLHPRLAQLREWGAALLAGLAQRPLALAKYVSAVTLGLTASALSFVLVLRSIGVEIGIFVAYACTSLTTIASAVPLTLNGVGLREWVIAAFVKAHFQDGGFASYVVLSYLLLFSLSGIGALLAALRPRKALPCPE